VKLKIRPLVVKPWCVKARHRARPDWSRLFPAAGRYSAISISAAIVKFVKIQPLLVILKLNDGFVSQSAAALWRASSDIDDRPRSVSFSTVRTFFVVLDHPFRNSC
jgi:hypothetical protein